MERLPDELLVLILRQLPVVQLLCAAKVCRRWEALVNREAMQLREGSQSAAVGKGLRVLLVTAPRVELLEPLLAARNLRYLTVHAGAPLSGQDFAALQCLPFLAHLDVFVAMRLLRAEEAPALRRLHTLVLNDNPAQGLLRALANDSALQELHMYGYVFGYESDELTALLTVRRLHLRELTLRCGQLRSSAYEAIGACDNLSQLRLYGCWFLTGEDLVHVARPRGLRVLHVSGTRGPKTRAMTSPAMYALLRALPPGMIELALSAWCSDEHVDLLAARLPQLQVLGLWHCRHLSSAAVTHLALALPALRDVDCDLHFSPEQLRSLRAHPALRHLRAMPPLTECTPSVSSTLVISSISADDPCYWTYGNVREEGYHARLFYYWTHGLHLPLPALYGRCFSRSRLIYDDYDYIGDVTDLAFAAPLGDGDC